jgi:beta-lactamase superfamily II metal-dependent hydrolase
LSVTAIGLYTLLVGAEAAVVRAALMGALSLFARQIGRQQDVLNSLGLVAALMALANPNILWDVGFQLSFMATLGLVLYATPLTEAFLRLDWLVVAGTSIEQIADLLNLLPGFTPDQALWAGAPLGTAAARNLQTAPGQAAIPIYTAEEGQALDLGQGARFEVLGANRSGAVLLLEWRNFRALLPIGLDEDLCQALPEEHGPMPVTALLLASSGAADSNPPEWLQAWDPQVVLLSVASGDRRARPAPEVVETLQGYTLLRTDQNGWVELTTDGEQLWVEVEKRFR